MSSVSGRTVVSFLGACALLAPASRAQDARVVSCNSANGRILELDFASVSSRVLIADNTRVSMQSCLFRNDGADGLHLLVADRKGEIVFYENGLGPARIVLASQPGNPANPDGLSEDPAQNLYGVSSSTGGSTAAEAKVWMLRRAPGGPLPGGYAGPVAYVDSSMPGVQQLSETILVTSNLGLLADGDLLVLASDPAMILRYRAADLAAFRAILAGGGTPADLTPEVFVHPSTAAVPAAQRFPAGLTPSGMDLTQEGSLLITASQGTILHFDASGQRRTNAAGQFVDFATGLGNGQFKIATGLQDGALRAFVTDRNGGEVHRFRCQPDGTGVLEATIADAESPNGIATTTAGVQFVPTGSGVRVASSDLIVSTIETVAFGGVTSISEYVFSDPREAEAGAPADPSQPLHRALDLNHEISSLLPAGVTIPAHVRAFRKADPLTGLATGAPTFLLIVVESRVQIAGTIQHIVEEELVLGYKPDCFDPDPTQRPRLFWRDNPDAQELPIPEGDFINVSNGCGSSRGMTMNYSLFLPGRETRPQAQVLEAQLSGLSVALDLATCVRSKTLKSMQRQVETAIREYFQRGRPDKALAALQVLQAQIEAAPGDFASCVLNERGNLRARTAAAIYTLQNP